MTERPELRVPDEPAVEHVRNAMQLFHNLTTYEMSSNEVSRYRETVTAIWARLNAAVAKLQVRR